MLSEYLYRGPVSSFHVRGQAESLSPGKIVKLPRGDARVRRMVARKLLIPVSMVSPEILQAAQGDPDTEGSQGNVEAASGGDSAAQSEGGPDEEQFPATNAAGEQGKVEQTKGRQRKRRRN